jgi:hypothetical protein
VADIILTGIITNKGREIFAKSFGRVGTSVETYAFKFKYGEGGYIDTISGKVPKDPSDGASLLDVEAAASPSLFEFSKNFVSADFLFIAPSTMQCRCRLTAIEANDDGFGDYPGFFELGIFDQNDNLIAYTTFAEQTKTPNKIVTNYVQIVF